MKNSEIAKLFSDIANMLELKGDNLFRVRAYRKAARNIEAMVQDITGLQPEELTAIPGVGHDLEEKIMEYTETGQLTLYNELKKNIPPPGLLHQFDSLRYGIGTARRAWPGKEQVMNTLPWKPLLKHLKGKIHASGEVNIPVS